MTGQAITSFELPLVAVLKLLVRSLRTGESQPSRAVAVVARHKVTILFLKMKAVLRLPARVEVPLSEDPLKVLSVEATIDIVTNDAHSIVVTTVNETVFVPISTLNKKVGQVSELKKAKEKTRRLEQKLQLPKKRDASPKRKDVFDFTDSSENSSSDSSASEGVVLEEDEESSEQEDTGRIELYDLYKNRKDLWWTNRKEFLSLGEKYSLIRRAEKALEKIWSFPKSEEDSFGPDGLKKLFDDAFELAEETYQALFAFDVPFDDLCQGCCRGCQVTHRVLISHTYLYICWKCATTVELVETFFHWLHKQNKEMEQFRNKRVPMNKYETWVEDLEQNIKRIENATK